MKSNNFFPLDWNGTPLLYVCTNFYSIYLFFRLTPLYVYDVAYPKNKMCVTKTKGVTLAFLWISIDHVKMMLISTYHLIMFFICDDAQKIVRRYFQNLISKVFFTRHIHSWIIDDGKKNFRNHAEISILIWIFQIPFYLAFLLGWNPTFTSHTPLHSFFRN